MSDARFTSDVSHELRSPLTTLNAGLQVLDISDPANPIIIGNYDSPGLAQDVHEATSMGSVVLMLFLILVIFFTLVGMSATFFGLFGPENAEVRGIRRGCRGVNQCAFLVADVQAVLAHQSGDLEIEGDVHGVQDLADLGFADLVVALVIEIDLVDGSAGGNDEQFRDHSRSIAWQDRGEESFHMGLNDSVSTGRDRRWLRAAALALVLVLAPVGASETDSALPGTRELAAALSDPGMRTETLLTLVAVQRLADYGRFARAHEVEEYVLRFRAERAWLERLSERYLLMPLRSSLLDPAAWLLLLELDQYDLSPGPAVSPFGPGTSELLGALFDPSGEAAAATILPDLLSRVEFESTALWRRVLEQAEDNVALARVLAELSEEWFDLWAAAEPPAPGVADPVPGIDSALALLMGSAGLAQRSGPPDALDLKRLRFQLLTRMEELSWQEVNDAAYLLGLANAVESLYQGRYRDGWDAVLADGGAYNFTSGGEPMTGWYMTIVPIAFDDADEALVDG